jgi:MYXO-CTERM domain-containing protein
MKSRFTYLIPLLLLAVGMSCTQCLRGNLFQNGSFESGTWTGSATFVDPNNATQLFTGTPTINQWESQSASYWVEDATRTPAGGGSRMVWLGPPATSSNTAISQTLDVFTTGNATTQLVGGGSYTLSLNFAYFDREEPNPAASTPSALQLYYVLYDSNGDLDPGSYTYFPLDPGNPSNPTALTGNLSSWSSGSGLLWHTASFDFQLPDVTGYSQIKFSVAAPQDSIATPSNGVLVDNVSLSAASPVPEPGAVGMLALSALVLWRRRR